VTEEVGPEPPVRVPISMESFKSVTIIPDDAYTLPSEGYVTFAVVGGGYYPVTGVGFSGSLDDFFERAWEKAQRMYPELRPDYRIPVSI
jgi:NADH dehydrogenase FAD-containing subunit